MSIFRGIATGFLGAAIEDKAAKDRNKAEVLKGAALNYLNNTYPETVEAEKTRKSNFEILSSTYTPEFANVADASGFTVDKQSMDRLYKTLEDNNLNKDKLKNATFATDYNTRYETRGKTFNEKYKPIFEQIGIKEIGGMGPYTVKSQLEGDATTDTMVDAPAATGETQQFSSTKLSDYLIPKPGVLQIPENEFGRVAASYRNFKNVISFDENTGNVKFAFKGTKDVEYNALRAVTNQVSGNFYNAEQKKVNVGAAMEEANKILTLQTESHHRSIVDNYSPVKTPKPGQAAYAATGELKISKDDLIMHVSKLGTKSEQRFYALSFPAGVTLPGTNTDVRQFLLNITR